MSNEESLDIEPLKNAVNALEASVCDYDEYFSKGGTLKNTLRSGVIQN